MSDADNPSDFLSVQADLRAGVAALDDGCFDHAHAILLTLFLSPEIPCWFRKVFCLPPVRELALAYLPTRASLCRMRRRATGRLMKGEHSAVLLHRVLMLDDALDDKEASYRLLRQLDVIAGSLLEQCRDSVVAVFANQGDMERAHKYLGDYRRHAGAAPRLVLYVPSVERQ